MNTTTSEPLQKALDLAGEILPELADLAGPIDEGTQAPAKAYALLRESGLLAAMVPPDRGGLGLDFAGYTTVLAELAKANGAIALGYNMHNVAIGSLFEADGDALGATGAAFRDWVVGEVVDGQRMFASAASEPSTGARLRGIATTYRREANGFVLSGHKSFVSLAGVADYYVVTARPDDADGDYEVSHFVVRADDPGVSFSEEWRGTALRGTSTAQMFLADTPIPLDRLFLGVEGMSLFKAVREPHWMAAGYLGAYLGLATSIVDFASERIGDDARRRDDAPSIQRLGSMAVDLQAARALTLGAARAVADNRSDTATNSLVYAAKYHLGETAQSLAAQAVALVGSASMAVDGPMQRLLREVQFCSIMPAKPIDCLNYVGRAQLGANMLDVSNHSW
ncbi:MULTISPECIES: acyl-CoA dehydrogenase family protein [unclassified Gordonia (in: high G+C Gram-positive bacteria)]|uniref:acyl-CoA dehydrogenase family protein n=1 Tax=unclassified Gordonia (in: high G+C Gram-positive bacteria) TaxID=2657482 RepID=UPI001F0E7A71|nr:acyl-CoA dehydrogenase family protein [Gordonia sp. ABSL49_1]MCH5641609.1 acyl-CoA/acyl-ACP dehydrogenase [Gordonia sp. ABSL49_1]